MEKIHGTSEHVTLSSGSLNFSSGKKQGEISCFDIAYTLFADEENIPCMHFLLNDKKELMHDNQLVKIANFVRAKGMQFVASILKDKLPDELNRQDFFWCDCRKKISFSGLKDELLHIKSKEPKNNLRVYFKDLWKSRSELKKSA